MKEEDKASTSFITPFGTYCFIRMPEGLKNAGSTFSRLTKTVLEGQVGRNIFTYVDDIVVASRSKEDHLADLAETFANMREARLRLNPEKCVFGVCQGKILGYLVSHRGIEANPTKIQAIVDTMDGFRRAKADKSIAVMLLQAAVAVVVPCLVALLLRRLAPKAASAVFGGR